MSDEIVVVGAEEDVPLAEWADVIEDEKELKDVVSDLCRMYNRERAARSEKERTWAKWRRQAEARPGQRKKNFPYPNASNVSPPLSQMIGQGIFAYLKGMYDEVDPPWYIGALREDDRGLIKQAEVLTKLFNIISKSRLDLNLSAFKRDFLNEVAVMGTCFVKVPWTTEPWHFKSEEGGVEETVSATLHDGPELIPIPVEDVIYPENYTEIQKMPWFAHDVAKAEYELKDLATLGVYDSDAVEQVIGGAKSASSDVRRQQEEEIMQSYPDREGEYVLTEFYFYYDSDGDDIHEDLVFTVHVPTGTVLRQDFNRFGYRMVSVANFIKRIYSLEGRGTGQTTEYQQDEIEGIHNTRNDNMKFSNMRMLAVRRGALRENESIYPGKIFVTDNPKEDINPIQLGEVYPSSLNAEQQTISYARESSGLSSTMSGFADQTLGSRDTYRGQAMRAQKGTSIFNTIAEGLNECFSEVGMMLFFQLVHNRERVLEKERSMGRLSPEEIEVLGQALNMNVRDVPSKLAFHIRTSNIDETYEAKRQNMLSLTQLFSQYAQQVSPLTMMLFGPQGMQMQQQAPDAYQYMLSIYVGSTKLMSEVFKFMGEEDPLKYVPDIKKQEFLLDMMNKMSGDLVDKMKGAGQGLQVGYGPGQQAADTIGGMQLTDEQSGVIE